MGTLSAIAVGASRSLIERAADGSLWSTTGVDGYAFWERYLEVFDEVLVAGRVGDGLASTSWPRLEGPGVRAVTLPDYHGPWGYVRARSVLCAAMRVAVAQADAICLRVPGPIGAAAWRLWGDRPFGVESIETLRGHGYRLREDGGR